MNKLINIYNTLKKYWVINILRIIGLIFGIASILTILIYLINETGYNKYINNRDDVTLLTEYTPTYDIETCFTPYFIGEEIKNSIPQIKDAARITCFPHTAVNINGTFGPNTIITLSIDSSFFNIFPLKFIDGNPIFSLQDKNSVIITKSFKDKYYKNENPIGKYLEVKIWGEQNEFVISGIINDMPRLSSIKADILVTNDFIEQLFAQLFPDYNPLRNDWNSNLTLTFLLKKSNASYNDIKSSLKYISDKYSQPEMITTFKYVNLKDLYFYSGIFTAKLFPYGDKNSIYIFSFIGLLILILMFVNLVILSLSLSINDLKKYCIFKILGARKIDIFLNEFYKILVITLISLPVAIILAKYFLPSFSNYFNVQLDIKYLLNYQFISKVSLIVFLLVLISSTIIAVFTFSIGNKSVNQSHTENYNIKNKILYVFTIIQLVIFFTLISSSIIINRQTRLLFSDNLGFDKSGIMIVPLPSGQESKYSVLKNELSKNTFISSISASTRIMLRDKFYSSKISIKDNPENIRFVNWLAVDKDFFKVMNIKIKSGEGFEDVTDHWVVLVNEQFVEDYRLYNPIGTVISDDCRIIGVVENFHFEDFKSKIKPMVIWNSTRDISDLIIKYNPEDLSDLISFIRTEWHKIYPDNEFNYTFFDDILEESYANDLHFFRLVTLFTFISVVIACLGLFGISFLLARKRVKEICIRRILGASKLDLYYAMLKPTMIQVFVAFFISVPISIIFLNEILLQFAYRIKISALDFVLVLLVGLSICIITVYFSIKNVISTEPSGILREE